MTTFQISKGKVVDRIELEEGGGKVTINVIYKEDEPNKKKPIAVLCETNEPTTIYYHIQLRRPVNLFYPVEEQHKHLFVPVLPAEAGEFVVIPKECLHTATAKMESCLSTCVCPDHAVDVAWRELTELFVEHK